MIINLYGIIFTLTFIVLFFIIKKFFEFKKINKELSYTAVIYLILGILIGARLVTVFY